MAPPGSRPGLEPATRPSCRTRPKRRVRCLRPRCRTRPRRDPGAAADAAPWDLGPAGLLIARGPARDESLLLGDAAKQPGELSPLGLGEGGADVVLVRAPMGPSLV